MVFETATSGRPSSSLASARERLLEIIRPDFEVARGRALPLGATLERGGVNFAVFSQHATDVTLVLFRAGESEAIAEFPLDPRGYTVAGRSTVVLAAKPESGAKQ